MRQINDYTDQKIGAYKVLRQVDKKPGSKTTSWECKCDCGNLAIRPGKKLQDHKRLITSLNSQIGEELFTFEDADSDCGCGSAKQKKLMKKRVFDKILRYLEIKKEIDSWYQEDLKKLEALKKEIEELRNVCTSA
jgi:hypothetical protein